MVCWFSCCYGSRKELPRPSPKPTEVESIHTKLPTSPSVKRLTSGSSPETAAVSKMADPLQSYVSSYNSMGTTPLPIRRFPRQTTEPIPRTAYPQGLEPSSAPVCLPTNPTLVHQSIIPVLYDAPPLLHHSATASELPTLARSFSLISQPDPALARLEKQICSLYKEVETFQRLNASLQKETATAKEELEKEKQKSESLKLQLEEGRRESIKQLQRNTLLEQRLAKASETILKQEKESFLKSPTEDRMERRGSLSDMEEEREHSINSDKTPTLLQVQEELGKMQSKYQRAVRHLKEVKEKMRLVQREKNRLEMELQTKADQVKELQEILERTTQNLEKRERAKSEIEKREVAVEKVEEHQAKDRVKQQELEEQLTKAEALIKVLREQIEELRRQNHQKVEEVEQLKQQLCKQEATIKTQAETVQKLEKSTVEKEQLWLEEHEKSVAHRQEIEQLQHKLAEASTILAGYELPKSGAGLKRSASLPITSSKPLDRSEEE